MSKALSAWERICAHYPEPRFIPKRYCDSFDEFDEGGGVAAGLRLLDDYQHDLLPLNTRARRALMAAGLTTVGQIRRTPDFKLRRLDNFGRVSLAEVRSYVPHEPDDSAHTR